MSMTEDQTQIEKFHVEIGYIHIYQGYNTASKDYTSRLSKLRERHAINTHGKQVFTDIWNQSYQ